MNKALVCRWWPSFRPRCRTARRQFEIGVDCLDFGSAGVSVLRDPYTAKPYVLFYTTKRVGGGVQDFDATEVIKFAAS